MYNAPYIFLQYAICKVRLYLLTYLRFSVGAVNGRQTIMQQKLQNAIIIDFIFVFFVVKIPEVNRNG